jgi:hypothetical protein
MISPDQPKRAIQSKATWLAPVTWNATGKLQATVFSNKKRENNRFAPTRR